MWCRLCFQARPSKTGTAAAISRGGTVQRWEWGRHLHLSIDPSTGDWLEPSVHRNSDRIVFLLPPSTPGARIEDGLSVANATACPYS